MVFLLQLSYKIKIESGVSSFNPVNCNLFKILNLKLIKIDVIVLRLHPIDNVYELHLTWALPPLLDKFMTKPLHYIPWIIGHEGKGSLLSYLR